MREKEGRSYGKRGQTTWFWKTTVCIFLAHAPARADVQTSPRSQNLEMCADSKLEDNLETRGSTGLPSILWPVNGEQMYGESSLQYQVDLKGVEDSQRPHIKNITAFLILDGAEVAKQGYLSLSDVGDGKLAGSFGIPSLTPGQHSVSVQTNLGSSRMTSPSVVFHSQPLPRCQVAVPGHGKVVRSDKIKVVVESKGPIEMHGEDPVLEVVAEGAMNGFGQDAHVEGQVWQRNGGWRLAQLTAEQRREGPSFVYDLELSDAPDGPTSITLLYHSDGPASQTVVLDRRDFFVSRAWNVDNIETMEDPCVRAVEGQPCRGCTVTAVQEGRLLSTCQGTQPDGAPRTVLQDDQEREWMAAAAAVPLLQAAGGNGIGWEGVTVTVTSCGRVALLKDTLRSLLEANTFPLAKILLVEDSADAHACAQIQHEFASANNRAGSLQPPVQVLCHKHREGQMRSLDHLYSQVTTRWVFHLEDDWRFDGTPGFIEDSIDILEDNPNCFQVHLRYREKSLHPAHQELFRSSTRQAGYRRLAWDQYGWGSYMWHGFSLGPGLRRLHHIRMLGAMEPYGSELHVQDAFQSMGLWAAALEQGVIEHTGDEWSERERWERGLWSQQQTVSG